MNAIIPATKKVSTKDGFVNPIRETWLDDYEAPPSKIKITFEALGVGTLGAATGGVLGALVDTMVSVAVGGTFIPTFTLAAGALTGLGLPTIFYHKLFGAYKKWDQVKTIIGNSLQTWLLENHNILLPDEKTLQQIVHEMRPRAYSHQENKEVYFYDADKKLHVLSKTPRSLDSRWEVREAATLAADGTLALKSIPGAKTATREKNTNLLWWNAALHKRHEALQKNIDMLHKQQLNIEDTHTLQRVEDDLDDLLRIAENIAKISSPNADDVQSLNMTFKVLEAELHKLTNNEIQNMRKELKVKESYITSRTQEELQHITLGR